MKNQQIASQFIEIASLLELKGENPFRIRAYQRAAQNIEGLTRDVAGMTDEELLSVSGIGSDLVGKIRQFLDTGRIDLHEDLAKEIPRGVPEILRISGVGPKSARMLYEKAGVRNLEDLETLTREGKLAGLPGILEATPWAGRYPSPTTSSGIFGRFPPWGRSPGPPSIRGSASPGSGSIPVSCRRSATPSSESSPTPPVGSSASGTRTTRTSRRSSGRRRPAAWRWRSMPFLPAWTFPTTMCGRREGLAPRWSSARTPTSPPISITWSTA